MKNLLVLCFGFFCIFTSFLSLRNLQSSINNIEGLGLYTLSCTYLFFFTGCIFATSVVRKIGPKKAMVVASMALLIYDVAHLYPAFYTMVPAGGLAGFAQGVIWTAHATYIANIAVCYANLSGEKVPNVLSKFNGIFFVFYQSCQIVGGFIASLILKSPANKYTGLFAFNGTSYNCSIILGVYNDEEPVDQKLIYILIGVFTGLTITGITVLAFLLDPLEGQMKMKKAQGPFHQQLLAVFKFYGDRKALCLVGIMFYSLLQAAFIFGEYNKAFITCTIGIEFVGFVMMTLSFSSANAAFWNGRIQKYIGRWPLLTTAFVCHGSVLFTLLFWDPSPSNLPVFFILVIFWGIGDGTIMTQDISLIGYLFSSNKEPAFAALKMTQSIANFIFFVAGPYMCTRHKIFFVGTVLCVATTGYFTLEVIMRREERLKAAQQPQLQDGDKETNKLKAVVDDEQKIKGDGGDAAKTNA
ncbi:hypothetical protein HELRODRAFT_83456 [Helobdella robusta]|uniref:Major facilitator superfamily (MFS) profile domain-containing protein n=1 Tax=Helobdella robusta TaxID=6412 RepID=T1G558_HELRO|nr:hypothetical protein HELRODRAFT_83456 [Helobdella robusta]ESN99915.1 hypothetical protein HELRODRAFT_83456 [Helobdella robusta]